MIKDNQKQEHQLERIITRGEEAETTGPAVAGANKAQGEKAQITESQGTQQQPKRTTGPGGRIIGANQGTHQDITRSLEEIGL